MFYLRSPAGRKGGFTLIESLVALAILAVIVGVLVNVHLQTLRAEAFSQFRSAAVLEGETILSQSLSGLDRQAIVDQAGQQGWLVTGTVATNAGVAGGLYEWRVAATNAGAPVVTMYLRPRGGDAGSHAR